MAFVVNDRVKETTTSTGTGTINLGGAETGFETFVAGIGNSNTTYYCIQAQGGSAFEIGVGTVTDASPDTLSRTAIISSSNSDAVVDFGAGTKDVFCTLPASKAVIEDNSTNADIAGNLTVGGTVDGVDIAARDAVLTSTTTTATNANTTANAALPKSGGTMTGAITFDSAQATGNSGLVPAAGTSGHFLAHNGAFAQVAYSNLSGTPTIPGGSNGIDFSDNVKARFGTGNDLEIYHDSNNSIIADTGTGGLQLLSSQFKVMNAAGDENQIIATEDGSVALYNDNTARLTTSASGFDGSGDTFTFSTGGTEFGRIENDSNDMYIRSMVSDKDIQFRGNDGGSEITALTLDMSAGGALVCNSDIAVPDNGKIELGAGDDLQFFHDTANNNILSNSGTLKIRSDSTVIRKNDDSEAIATFTANGAVELYHDNTKMFSTTSTGCQVEADRRIDIVNGSNWSGEQAGKIEHHSNNMYHQFTSNWIARNASGTDCLNVDSSGNITANGNVTAFSDIRLKEDIKTIDNALDKVCAMRGVEYTRKQTGDREIGVIANEVKEVIPELVSITDLRSAINPEELNNVHTMKYQNTVGLLIEAIKDLKTEVEELKKAK